MRTTSTITAHGETKSFWSWGTDERCFFTPQAFYSRMVHFPREITPADAEAALCLPRKTWVIYRQQGYLTEAQLAEALEA